jgi:hypothetical protein
MPTIRVRDWTKDRIEEIRETESHSSNDSVIKSLLKDRQLAQQAVTDMKDTQASETEPTADATEPSIPGLTTLAELTRTENGVLFIWCPNCENEIAHASVSSPIDIDVFEIECQQCLTQLDQHALVAIDLSYPIEGRLVDGTLIDDLQECVVDYWDRALRTASTAPTAETSESESPDADNDKSIDRLVWRIDRYVREFNWEWPASVPIVAFEVDKTYTNTQTGERFRVIERLSNNRTDVDSYRICRFSADADVDTESTCDPENTDEVQGEVETLESETVSELILDRAIQQVE